MNDATGAGEIQSSPGEMSNVPVLSFTHRYGDIEAELEVRKITYPPMYPGDPETQFLIKSGGKNLGLIYGFLSTNKDNEAVFTVNEIQSRFAIPRAVGGTIAQLVAQGVITKWYSSDWNSSDEITSLGAEVYEKYLAADPRLTVTKEPQVSGQHKERFLVTKK